MMYFSYIYDEGILVRVNKSIDEEIDFLLSRLNWGTPLTIFCCYHGEIVYDERESNV